MRVTQKEIDLIKKAFEESFKKGSIYLFGSRLDDSQKGGDIDLYIIPAIPDNIRELKAKFLLKLFEYLGEQKIDVVVAKDKNRLIEQEALEFGIEL